ncbi:MAG: site-specific DNA-methyltransferase [Chloroflexi bacterium]|nr:site-specific DNA-methyltransferase [Chloroflexota bacterium]MCY4248212.1 site-specific DNA-methyltransferase [Chloroflexota bacterium]
MEARQQIVLSDNLPALRALPEKCAALVYIDPPFNTGAKRTRKQIRAIRDDQGDRVGFGGNRYRSIAVSTIQHDDQFDDFLGFLAPRLQETRRILTDDGSLFFHIDYREAHYCKILLDEVFGRSSFMNEIIWAYDFGGRSKRRWPAKHDTIFWYAKDPKGYIFNYDEIDRIPYMVPGLVGKEKAARGKTPTDVWWHTIVPTNGKEKTGYPSQKPLGILERIIKVHSNPNDLVVDFFAGSGTTGVAAASLGRRYWLCDNNPEAIEIIKQRLSNTGRLL